MKLLNVQVVGSSCIVKDIEGNTILEVLGDKVHWVDEDTLGNSNSEFVIQYMLNELSK